MKSYAIIGYSFDSQICCPACTIASFENGWLRRPSPQPPLHLDCHGLPMDLEDREDNEVHPIFRDTKPDGFLCDDCGEEIE